MEPVVKNPLDAPWPSTPSLSPRDQALHQLVLEVARKPKLVEKLKGSFIPKERDALITALQELLPQESRRLIKDVWSGLLTYCRCVPFIPV